MLTLTPLKAGDFDGLIDWAWGLATDRSRSSYPTYTDGVKTREDFVRRAREALSREDEEILLARQDGRATGWIHWYVLPEERYAGCCSVLTERDTAETLTAFEDYAAAKYPGFTLSLGFPGENQAACGWAEKNGFTLEDDLTDTVFRLDGALTEADDPHVERVARATFPDFRHLHDGEPMFWNSDRILTAWERWLLLLYRREGEPVAAAYVMDGALPELFGLDGAEDEAVRRPLLTACLRELQARGRRHLIYFAQRQEIPLLRSMGFTINRVYHGYTKVIGGMSHGGADS